MARQPKLFDEATVVISVRLPPKTVERVRLLARRLEVDLSDVVRASIFELVRIAEKSDV